ncbi:RNA 2'-phosphotransferase [Archaeoglobus veneficus]|uniref:Probable RNA 2'-phosphotransferase n=1 Tax=Archaeoglobus veneficus (strain DSM 11195 / SNP6) TaxID=693661 RepID=F2KRN5_ARCVS|nr:RNA 2'-phosphotransferase [Archaeoglobus veneficus]AEA46800.1 RNA 2'-phosphotransferase [Archaeoglobus veneficus SNP6]
MEDIRICPTHGFYRGESCKCGYKGELILDKERVEKLGRLVSGILRHFPDKFRLEMDEDGWVDFDALARVVSRKYRWANQWLIKAMIYSDEKKRYELKDNRIRARYGHSVRVKLSDYPPAEEDVLYYGTGEEEAHRLLEIGIKPVNQAYVHLSTTIEKSEEVARLRTDDPIILEIDAKAAMENGIRIIKANDYIALAEEIPPKYIKRVIRL